MIHQVRYEPTASGAISKGLHLSPEDVVVCGRITVTIASFDSLARTVIFYVDDSMYGCSYRDSFRLGARGVGKLIDGVELHVLYVDEKTVDVQFYRTPPVAPEPETAVQKAPESTSEELGCTLFSRGPDAGPLKKRPLSIDGLAGLLNKWDYLLFYGPDDRVKFAMHYEGLEPLLTPEGMKHVPVFATQLIGHEKEGPFRVRGQWNFLNVVCHVKDTLPIDEQVSVVIGLVS